MRSWSAKRGIDHGRRYGHRRGVGGARALRRAAPRLLRRHRRRPTVAVQQQDRKDARTLAPARKQVNLIASRKREHSRKPDELYDIVVRCSRPPFIELFARGPARPGWSVWGAEAEPAAPLGDVAVKD